MKYLSIVLLFLASFILPVQAQNIRLFHIERNKDKDLVCYDLCMKNGCINKNNSIHGYWKRAADGSTDELSYIQNKLAFGFDIKSVSENKVVFTMKAYDKRNITVYYDEGAEKYYATMTIDGKTARLEKLYVFANPPLYTTVPYIELYGKDLATGNKVYEKIKNE